MDSELLERLTTISLIVGVAFFLAAAFFAGAVTHAVLAESQIADIPDKSFCAWADAETVAVMDGVDLSGCLTQGGEKVCMFTDGDRHLMCMTTDPLELGK